MGIQSACVVVISCCIGVCGLKMAAEPPVSSPASTMVSDSGADGGRFAELLVIRAHRELTPDEVVELRNLRIDLKQEMRESFRRYQQEGRWR